MAIGMNVKREKADNEVISLLTASESKCSNKLLVHVPNPTWSIYIYCASRLPTHGSEGDWSQGEGAVQEHASGCRHSAYQIIRVFAKSLPRCLHYSIGSMSSSKSPLDEHISKPHITDTTSLCAVCQTISVGNMRGPAMDQMQPHQPSYLALKLSAEAGCQLCKFICTALSNGDGNDSAATFAQVCERYPCREISLVAWGGAGSNFDRIHTITTGDIPDVNDDGNEGCDPTMHPDHQLALDGVLEIYTYPGMTSRSVQLCGSLTLLETTPQHAMVR
jgi:hypothetical protein